MLQAHTIAVPVGVDVVGVGNYKGTAVQAQNPRLKLVVDVLGWQVNLELGPSRLPCRVVALTKNAGT